MELGKASGSASAHRARLPGAPCCKCACTFTLTINMMRIDSGNWLASYCVRYKAIPASGSICYLRDNRASSGTKARLVIAQQPAWLWGMSFHDCSQLLPVIQLALVSAWASKCTKSTQSQIAIEMRIFSVWSNRGNNGIKQTLCHRVWFKQLERPVRVLAW